jgi:hypothetical protein
VDDIAVDGREAERLLNDPTLKKVFARLEEVYVSQWKIAKSKDDREKFHSNVTALGDIWAALGTMKTTKALAESEDKRFGRNLKR